MDTLEGNCGAPVAEKQNDSSACVVLAIADDAVFNMGLNDESTKSELALGNAWPFLQAIHKVNEKLLEMNPKETLLFEIVLVSKNREGERQQQISHSVKRHSLDIGKVCFCTDETFAQSLLRNRVKLFLSTETEDIIKAQEEGVQAALLYSACDLNVVQPLKILFMGDALSVWETGDANAQELLVLIGEMRRRFGPLGSPLCTSLLITHSASSVCADTLRMLRHWGLQVDQAFCLAGAPKGPILAHIQPHILYDPLLMITRDIPALH